MTTPNKELEEASQIVIAIRNRLNNEDFPSAQRFDVMSQLEIACLRFAELSELNRLAINTQQALDSGLIEAPVAIRELGECPICFEEIPKTFPATTCAKRGTTHHQFFCCGAVCCANCLEQRHQKTLRTLERAVPFPDVSIMARELSTLKACPFCRSPNNGHEHLVAQVRSNAEAGKSWAQYMLGQSMAYGWMGTNVVPINRHGALEWFQLAADDGDLLAIQYLAQLWEDGFPEVGIPPDIDKAKGYYLQAARKGHWNAQYSCFLLLPTGKEAMSWLMLSASQGYATGQADIGTAAWDYYHVMKESEASDNELIHDLKVHAPLFEAIYWLRMAALQGDINAQVVLPFVLLNAKAWIYGQPDIVGYSAVPEACFWFDLAEDEANDLGVKRPEILEILVECARCGKRGDHDTRMKRCTKCKGAAYCGRDCQAEHWKMGHKRDCQVVKDIRNALKVPSPTGYIYPIQYSDP